MSQSVAILFDKAACAAVAADSAPCKFATRPSDAAIEAFLQHIRDTGEPESFPMITTTKPSASSRPVFLRQFSIDRKRRRNGDEAPCPICSPSSPKYLHDAYFTWYPDEQCIRAIGPECGDTIFGGTQYTQAKVEFSLQERERLAVDFLHKNLSKASSVLVALRALEIAVVEADRLHKQLRTSAPRIHAKLRQVKAAGGALRVLIAREKKNSKGGVGSVGPRGFGKADSEYDTIEEVFGHLPDTTALNAKFDAVADLKQLIETALQLPTIFSSDHAFYWACDASEDLAKLEASVAILRNSAAGYVKLADRLDRFAAFFSPVLFGHLNRWGTHQENQFSLEAEVSGNSFRLEHAPRWNDRDRVLLRPDMTRLMSRGNLPGFE